MARTLRVQRAKRLLDQTKLSMSDVAARASPACTASMPCSPRSTSARRARSVACASSRYDGKEKGPACAGPSERP
ncbi:MAG TPA: hypothetical protein VK681_36970 [Reyranella sp.]|nr:hypothetical protein [Reyranella sp.]